jgi:hypothetical protein
MRPDILISPASPAVAKSVSVGAASARHTAGSGPEVAGDDLRIGWIGAIFQCDGYVIAGPSLTATSTAIC